MTTSRQKQLIIAALSAVIFLAAEKYRPIESKENKPSEAIATDQPRLKIPSGWDSRGRKLYEDRANRLLATGSMNITYWHFQHRGQFVVSKDLCNPRNFWDIATRGGWERRTFNIFEKYVVPHETTVVDFGTWIGPTLLHHGSFSRHSFGIEADPVAYAVAEENVRLNRQQAWGQHVSMDSGCIARPEDVGMTEMKAGGGPGQSMSTISEKASHDKGRDSIKWLVDCYTLPSIFENYWRIEKPYKDVLVKIDVESYECKLIPSFYEWLKDERYLPIMFVTFHPQISACTDDEYAGVVKFLSLYDHVRVGDTVAFPQNATMEYFKATIHAKNSHDNGIVAYQRHHAKRLSKG